MIVIDGYVKFFGCICISERKFVTINIRNYIVYAGKIGASDILLDRNIIDRCSGKFDRVVDRLYHNRKLHISG